MQKGIFPFWMISKSTNILAGVCVPLQELCFPPRLISRHKASSPMPPPNALNLPQSGVVI